MIRDDRICDCCGITGKAPGQKIPVGWHGLILTYKEKTRNGCVGGMFGRVLLCGVCSTTKMLDRLSASTEAYLASMLKEIKRQL